jgi:hypothetical protein
MFMRNTQTEQFWHPVMGAVDLITRDVMRRKELARQQAVLQEKRQYDQSVDQYKYTMESIGKALGDPNVDPEIKTGLMKSMATMKPGAVQPMAIKYNTRKLRPDVAESFKGLIDPTKEYYLPQALALEQEFDKYKESSTKNRQSEELNAARIRELNSMTSKNERTGPKTPEEKAFRDALDTYKASGGVLKQDPDTGKWNLSGGDAVLRELARKALMELKGWKEPQQPAVPTMQSLVPPTGAAGNNFYPGLTNAGFPGMQSITPDIQDAEFEDVTDQAADPNSRFMELQQTMSPDDAFEQLKKEFPGQF